MYGLIFSKEVVSNESYKTPTFTTLCFMAPEASALAELSTMSKLTGWFTLATNLQLNAS